GGREHALAWKLAQSPHVKHVFVAPGNAGTADSGKISNSAVLVSNHTIVTQFCKDHNIGLVLVGPEALLAAGIVDDLRAAGVRCFGPCARAAQLASNSSSSKAFLERHRMPTARWRAFSNPQEACRFITSKWGSSGGTGSKGMISLDSLDAVGMADPPCASLSAQISLHEWTECLERWLLLKNCFKGKNFLYVPEALLEQIRGAILQHIVDSLRQEGAAYVGVLQAGLMLTKEGVKILNFKCQFGDPQCQVILPLLKNDFYEVIQAAIDGKLCSCMPAWSENRTAVCVVMASPGYPGDSDKGMEVTGGRSEGGGFAAFFDLKASGYHDPILVSQTKGLGPKLQVAQVCKRHDTIGQELVALCVNDLLAQGAEPLFFLTHLACGKLDAEVLETIKEGIAEACRSAGCAFLEVASPCPPGHCDLAGFVVGAVERGLGLQRAQEGDVLLGLGSPSIHGRGFGVVRRILLTSSLHCSSPAPGSCGDTTLGVLAFFFPWGKMFSPALLPILRSGHVKGFAPTAEGLLGGISRLLPEHLSAVLDALSWKIPEIFCWLYKEGNLSAEEMAQTFPCGIGAVLVVQKELAQHVLQDIQRQQEAWLIGKVVAPCHTGSHIEVENLAEALQLSSPQQLLSNSSAEIQPRKRKVKLVLVISNRPGVEELRSAARAGIPTRVIDHKLYGSRSEFDSTIDRVLEEFSVELICLSGFMRVLSSPFLRKWKGWKCPSRAPGKWIQSHRLHCAFRPALCSLPTLRPFSSPTPSPVLRAPSALPVPSPRPLSPSLPQPFPSRSCPQEEPSAGAAIRREPLPGDPEAALEQRLREAELRAFPLALQLVASGAVWLGAHGRTCWRRDGQEGQDGQGQDGQGRGAAAAAPQ
ncbi:Trifunctional purine biosynthetic protein adenosine-3, partial [Lamprotornis superbus]